MTAAPTSANAVPPHLDAGCLNAAAAALRARLPAARPRAGLVLGSGWNGVMDALTVRGTMPFDAIPGLGAAGVSGHPGRIHHAELAGLELLVFEGRRHWYEGAGWLPVLLPVHLIRTAGASAVILTNAAGGIRPDLAPGDAVLIDDHLNAMGVSPFTGPHQPAWGPRFPDLSTVYDPALRDAARAAAASAPVPLAHGVYVAVAGPAYETPAEVRALRASGADLVGMSTVPEAVAAHASGLRVLALSCISNRAAGLAAGPPLSHHEVLATLNAAAPRLKALLVALAARLHPLLPPAAPLTPNQEFKP